MKTNEVPSFLTAKIRKEADDPDYDIGSFCVNESGDKAVLSGYGQDPDFPELWIYQTQDDQLNQIDMEGELIDFPLGKAFWAKNQKDIVINHWRDRTLYTIEFDTTTWRYTGLSNYRPDIWSATMFNEVIDLFHPDNNKEQPKIDVVTDAPFKSALLEFCSEFIDATHSMRNLCQLSRAKGVEDWKHLIFLYSNLKYKLETATEKYGIDLQTLGPDLGQHLTPIEAPPFEPVIGKQYQISWGEFLYQGQLGDWTTRIRVDGPTPAEWIDIEDDAPLHEDFRDLEVKWFREID